MPHPVALKIKLPRLKIRAHRPIEHDDALADEIEEWLSGAHDDPFGVRGRQLEGDWTELNTFEHLFGCSYSSYHPDTLLNKKSRVSRVSHAFRYKWNRPRGL